MANDENKIILEFPATNVEIEFGETITFDNISGFLNSDRVTYNGESLTEEIAHLENDKADNTKIAPEYDEEDTYYRGDIVLYNGVLYECNITDTSGEFYPSDWKEITLGEGIEEVRNLLDSDYYTKLQSDYRFLGKTNPSGTGYFSLNRKTNTTVGNYSVVTGYRNTASGTASHAENWQTTASGDASHAEGETTTASGYASHSEGETTTASGDDSHAEGKNSNASGNVSHAEGENNTASGYASHSEGYGNAASGLMAHAEGVTTESSGYASHSEGVGTIANHIGQHVIGTYNVADTSTAEPTAKGNYIEIVGNGTDDNRRRNARTLDWSGNETLMGDLTYNGNKSLTSEISRLDGRVDDLPEPMVFKGTLGVGGTIETLPTASASNEGWTFKCITAGTYAGLTLKVGDTVTCFNPPNTSNYYWDKTGSQDTDTDTWRAIKVNGVEKLGNGISSGAVDFVGSENIEVDFDGNGNKVGVKTKNIYTKSEVDDIVYDILPDDTASGSIANFETDLALPLKAARFDVNASGGGGTPTTPIPIVGVSSVSVTKCGKNLFDDVKWFTDNGYTLQTDGSWYKATNALNATIWENKSKYEGQITIHWTYKYDSSELPPGLRYRILYTDGTGEMVWTSQVTTFTELTKTSASGKIVDKVVTNYGTQTNGTTIKDFCIELGESTYEPYNGTTEVIQLGGTYYGGEFTQDKNGKRQFKVTHKRIELSELTDWSRITNYTNPFFRATLPNDCKVRLASNSPQIAICDSYSWFSSNQNYWQYIGNYEFVTAAFGVSAVNRVYIRNDDYTDKDTFVSSLSGVYMVYELATPIIIDLTDGEPITTLLGINNVYADTGDTSVVFKDSVNGYVEKKIASVQALILNG